MCKLFQLITLLSLSSLTVVAQDTLRYSRQECEAIFLKENLTLLAEKLNISKSEAAVQQAKLWPNPSLTLDEINLWATAKQTGGNEVSPPFWNNVGRNQQLAMELEQLIQTAGKRKKLIAIEKVGVEKSSQYFQELLRNLKAEFRQQLTELQYTQLQQNVLSTQLQTLKQITSSYENQVKQGNIAQSQLVRLKAQELEIRQDINSLRKENNEIQSQLKTLMHLSPLAYLQIDLDDFDKHFPSKETLNPSELLSMAKKNRPDLQLALLEESYSSKVLSYERAQRVPDITIKGSYDRNGSTMLNFVGFGASMDLPFFNRNQGNIKAAEFSKQQSTIQHQQLDHSIENELIKSYQNYLLALQLSQQIEDNYLQTLDEMLEAYTKNFKQQNISVLEYLDFLEAYLDNRKSILDATKSVRNTAEELNYTVGADIISL